MPEIRLRPAPFRSVRTTRSTATSLPSTFPSASSRGARSSGRAGGADDNRTRGSSATCRSSTAPRTFEKVAAILADPEVVAQRPRRRADDAQNAEVARGCRLPMCQDTGPRRSSPRRGQRVFTGVKTEEWLSRGVFETYTKENLRYSQTVALTMYEEKNSGLQPPGADSTSYAADGERLRVRLHRQGGRVGQQVDAVPGDQGAAESREPREVPGGEAAARWAPRPARRTTWRS